MPLNDASIAGIVRSEKKDEEYIQELGNSISSLAEKFLKPAQRIRWQRELLLTGPLTYYAATTLCGLQTLGEEYVGLIETVRTSSGRLNVPSVLRRLLFIILQVLGPYLSNAFLSKARRTLLSASPETNHSWIRFIDLLCQPLIPSLQRLHLALFYIRGYYYHLSKRVTGVTYKTARPGPHSDTYNIFRWLGYLTVFQLISASILWTSAELKRYRQQKKKEWIQDKVDVDVKGVPNTRVDSRRTSAFPSTGFRCQLCLDEGQPAACTPCGHPFCWQCLLEHVTEHNSCPVCRSTVSPSRVVPLMNI